MFYIGNLVINNNDLTLKNINGYNVAISVDVYKILNDKTNNGYYDVENIRTHNKYIIAEENLVRVY